MKEYLTGIKSLWDILLSCGNSMSETEVVHIAIGGLGVEYDAIVAAVTTQKELPNWKTLCALLYTTESRILENSVALESMSANVAFQQRKSSNLGGFNGRFGNRGRARSGFFGRGRSSQKLQCQLCGRLGHTVHRCYHRFDISYNPEPNNRNFNTS